MTSHRLLTRTPRREALPVRVAQVTIAIAIAALLIAPRTAAARSIEVGTRHVPPFAIQEPDGSWSGLAIELWERVAADLELESVYRPHTVDGLIAGLENGELGVAVAALTVTAEREGRIDFSHPFEHTGLGIAVGSQRVGVARAIAELLLSRRLLQALFALATVLFLAGLVVWLFERRANREQFGEGRSRGLGDAFWWAAVTMTTVGYGDKAPRTAAGRAVAIVWMFASVIMISSFTAAIASSFTIAGLRSAVTGPDDLQRARVGTVDGTTASAWLARRGLGHQLYDEIEDALSALHTGELDAVVYDAPVLRYLIQRDPGRGVTVLDATFEPQDYGFGLPTGSPLRETLNQAMLRHLASPWWRERVQFYGGT